MTDLADSQRLFGLGDLVSVLEFKIDDIYQAGEVGDELQKEAGKGFMATNWMEQNRALFRALRLERFVTFITIGLIVFVAALNILISLIMMVMEKTKDIAVLVSMGAKRSQVRGIFILQGVLIGVIGTVIGLVVGLWAFLGGRTLSLDCAFRRGLLDRLRAVRAASARWPSGRPGRTRNQLDRHHLSFVLRLANPAGRGVAIRVSCRRRRQRSQNAQWRGLQFQVLCSASENARI